MATRWRIKATPKRDCFGPVFYWSKDVDWTTDVAEAKSFSSIEAATTIRVWAGVPNVSHLGGADNYVTMLDDFEEV